ncbi:uncharacterized protein LOC142209213 [Leptodactylus fuscus]|uniref:uncharacterized protein LOC142209213 n=1 Tax=Leptodactylus fuscus TaxID=238119 RepID=UPI003F4E6161
MRDGAAEDATLKGCRIFTCSSSLGFSTQTSSVSVQCCNSSLCNDFNVIHHQNTEANGIECYSCNTVNDEGCSEEEVTKTQCYGALTSCINVIGTSKDDELTTPIEMKGCATPNMCDSSFLPTLQYLRNANVQCCNGSLCNKVYKDGFFRYHEPSPGVYQRSCAAELRAMALNIPVFVALVTSCLLGTGCLCLECFVCNDLSDSGCSNQFQVNCTGDNNVCSAVSFSSKIGSQVETRTVKSCEKGSPLNSISQITSNGLQIVYGKSSCNSSLCNENVNDLSKKLPQDEVKKCADLWRVVVADFNDGQPNSPPIRRCQNGFVFSLPKSGSNSSSGLECYACLSTNKSECSNELAKKVKCPGDLNACYQAEGNLTLGGSAVHIFVKQCSIFTNVTTIVIGDARFNMSLIAEYCTGNLCNENLSPAKTTKQVLTPEVTPEATTEVITAAMNSTTATTVANGTSITMTTKNGIGRTYPCYVAMAILVAMESLL